MAAGEDSSIREDEQRAWKAAPAMEAVGKAGHRTKEVVGAGKEELDSFAERIGLGSLDGEHHGRRVEMRVDGHVVEREMHCWVEARRGRGELAHAQEAKPGRTERRPEHSIVKVGEVQRGANQQHEILSDGKTGWTDGALQRLGTSDTTKHVLEARGANQWVTKTQVNLQ